MNILPTRLTIVVTALFSGLSATLADVATPSIIGDHMVLQRDQANPVWGWADPGERVTVAIAGQRHTATADASGDWRVVLEPLAAGGPHRLTISGKNTLDYDDVLVGEVWICSGQSNMQWSVSQSYDGDLVALAAKDSGIRLISVPQVGTQEPQRDFDGEWAHASPETVASFSAVGYRFGLQLRQALGVPVGLIDNAWGGSAAEAWVRRDLLESDSRYRGLLEHWEEMERTYDHGAELARFEARLARWRDNGQEGRRPREPRSPLLGQHRPGNLFNGVLYPTIGYGIKGAIWYQGEANASRAYQYRHLFPLMIQHWRDEWGQGDFPFYFVQLADYRSEVDEPADADWAELREAQTMVLDHLPNTGQAVIVDVGEGRDIHPRDKRTVANRLARWALARDYDFDIEFQSPRFKSMQVKGSKVVISFNHVGQGGLRAFDTEDATGFAIAGEDRAFVWASARVVSEDTVEVWSDSVAKPVAVRYAWSNNPVCNLFDRNGLPVTPFRTDNWPMITEGVHHR